VTDPLRVVVVDDHPVYRGGLQTLFATVEDIDVVGAAASGEEAVALCAELLPDVVVMDLNMPGMNGIEATRAITGAQPSIGVLVLTMYDDDESVFSALCAGARGYLLKGSDQAEIERGVRAVAAGQAIFGPAMAVRIAEWFSGRAQPPAPAPAFAGLTPREHEVLELIAAGLNNAAIARTLFLSEKTVRNHVSNVFDKLQAADRAEAIVRAREAGYGRS
jgi:DNA-binding NarL/FixJ family response regulator